MDAGYFLLYSACACGAIDAGLLLTRDRWKKAGKILAYLTAGLITASLLLLAGYFATDNFSVLYVWRYSSADLAPELKLSAVWAGPGGSLLFWTFLIYLLYAVFRRAIRSPEEASRRAFFVLSATGLVFACLTAISRLFDPTPPHYLVYFPHGYGLTPVLRSFWMIFHPPTTFIGYAATTVPAAIALANLSLGREGLFADLEKLWVRIAWLFLGLGIILGGVWAYEVLGWGGYWAWDPLETASLLPWLMCTAYFHAEPVKRYFRRAKEAVLIASFVLVIFTTLVVRGALIDTIHGYPAAPETIPLICALVGLAAAISIAAIAFAILKPLPTSGSTKPTPLLSLPNLHVAAYTALLSCTVASFIGTITAAPVPAMNLVNYPFAFLFLIALLLCNTIEHTNSRYVLGGAIATLALGAMLGGRFTAWLGARHTITLGNQLADLGLPFLVLSLVLVAYAIAKDVGGGKMTVVQRKLIHVAVVILLLGAFLSSTGEVARGWARVTPGTPVAIPGTDIVIDVGNPWIWPRGHMHNLTIHGVVFVQPQFYELKAPIFVYQGGRLVGQGFLHCIQDPRPGWNYSSVFIARLPLQDIYLHAAPPPAGYLHAHDVLFTTPHELAYIGIWVRVINYVNILWIGCALLLLAILPFVWESFRRKH